MSREIKSNQELTSTKRGRVFQSAGPGRSAMERPTEPDEHEKTKFAKRLSQFLSNNATQYERLFIAAAPQTLGVIRKNLTPTSLGKISMTLDKDLTHYDKQDIPRQFGQLLHSTLRP